MDPNYRARPDDWRMLEIPMIQPTTIVARAVLELRARIEALEAAQQQPDDCSHSWAEINPVELGLEPAPPAPAEGLLERVAILLANRLSASRPGNDCKPFACDVLREVAAATDQMAPDRNLTWERVALWLEREAER